MINSTSLLFEIQKIDQDLHTLESRMIILKNEINDNSLIIQAEKQYNEVSAILLALEKESSDLGGKINEFKNKKQQLNASLYSGKIQNSKELSDLQKEIESITKIIASLEDSLILKWDEIENAQIKQENLKSEFLSLQNSHGSRIGEIQQVLDQINNDIARLQVQKRGISDQISSSFIEEYNRLFSSKKGIAVAKVTDSYCSGCGSSLTPSDCQNAKIHSKIIYCSNCGRILYAD